MSIVQTTESGWHISLWRPPHYKHIIEITLSTNSHRHWLLIKTILWRQREREREKTSLAQQRKHSWETDSTSACTVSVSTHTYTHTVVFVPGKSQTLFGSTQTPNWWRPFSFYNKAGFRSHRVTLSISCHCPFVCKHSGPNIDGWHNNLLRRPIGLCDQTNPSRISCTVVPWLRLSSVPMVWLTCCT